MSSENYEEYKRKQNVFTLAQQYADFIELIGIDPKYIHVNRVILLDVVMRYWRDVERLHTFHSIDRIDRHKIAGYVTYWITKLRPISVLNDAAYKEPFTYLLLNINQYFALYVSMGRIVARAGVRIGYGANLFQAIIYTLNYRLTSGDNLAIMYYFIENGLK